MTGFSTTTPVSSIFYIFFCYGMKAHKYWSLGALATMIGTFYTGYKDMKSAHKYFACSSLLCMIMAIYSGHKMISGKSRKKKDSVSEESAE